MSLTEMKEFLNQGWVGSALGVIGIVSATIMGLLFKSRSRITTQVNSLQLLGSNPVLPKEIEFLFRGRRVPNVTLSHVSIWNMGNTTLKRDQIVTTDPLRIVTSVGGTVLEATILQRTREVNDFSCVVRSTAGNEVECQFDYLDPGDGALIKLIHTGDDKVRVVGTLRGVPKGIWVSGVPKRPESKEQAPLSPSGAMAMGVIFLLLGLPGILAPFFGASGPWPLIGGTLAVLGVMFLWVIPRVPPSQLSTQITTTAIKRHPWFRWFR